mmetsp:Transcript_3303/g.6726  ORF Transcript_3303/g.6726 Transcript_3303/m.6726 type:complete len:478 (+) Transcript_3303:32-1465(+)
MNPFDFDSYIQQYHPPTLLPRLMHIANANVDQQHNQINSTMDEEIYEGIDEAIRAMAKTMALEEAKKEGNTIAFKKLTPESSRSSSDVAWLQSQSTTNSSTISNLQSRLNTSKSQLNKSATLENYKSLGEEFRRQGRETEGLRELGRAQAFCTNQEQTFQICYTLTTLSLSTSANTLARSQASKGRSTPSNSPLSKLVMLGGGIVDLIEGKWKGAWEVFTTQRGIANNEEISKLTSPSDVALYAVICGIVGSIPLTEITSRLGSDEWREWGEGETEGMRIYKCYVKGEYNGVMEGWERLRTRVLCDIYLSPHYSTLTHLLRQRCLTQYTLPYSTVLLTKASSAVGISPNSGEEIVADLIRKNKIQGKIDEREGLLRMKGGKGETNKVSSTVLQACRTADVAMIRMSLIEKGVIAVRGKGVPGRRRRKRKGGRGVRKGGMTDDGDIDDNLDDYEDSEEEEEGSEGEEGWEDEGDMEVE